MSLYKEELMRFTKLGEAYIDDEFLASPEESPIADNDAFELLDYKYSLSNFNLVVSDHMLKYEEKPEDGDAELAVKIFKSLGLARRVAMDVRVWHFLTCAVRPDYVLYRWGPKVSRERFLGGIKRNAFARLWWSADILRAGDDYSRLDACFSSQDLYEAVFGRVFSKFPPAAKAFIDAVKGQHRIKVIRPVAKDLSYMLSTFALEDLSESQIYDLVSRQVQKRSLNST